MTKKYILKPGRHQFVPGSHAIHHNNNLTDEEAQWYLARYPDIVSKFDTIPKETTAETDIVCRVSDEKQPEHSPTESVESSAKQSVESNSNIGEIKKIKYEDLPSAN